MSEPTEEQLNVYDAEGRVVGVRRRSEAKSMGLAVGAVNVLIVNARGELLLQRRPVDKENGGRWDKSVGGHVGAGEEFDDTARRECGEELFDDASSPRVQLVAPALLTSAPCADGVVIAPLARQLNLRDVRLTPQGTLRNVLYHVALYAGRTDLDIGGFSPQASEIDALGFFAPAAVDAMLVRGELAPNMAFTWLAAGYAVLRAAGR